MLGYQRGHAPRGVKPGILVYSDHMTQISESLPS